MRPPRPEPQHAREARREAAINAVLTRAERLFILNERDHLARLPLEKLAGLKS
jgi:hypothetical protein